jgi:HEAT repeat protein
MLELLKTEPEEHIRESAARQLETVAPIRPEVARALLEALRDASPKVGREAAASLAQRGVTTGAIVPGLLTALEDSSLDEQVRGQVAITLAKLKERAVVPVAMRLLDLPDEAFERGLDEFTGRMSSPLMKVDMARALGETGPLAREVVPTLLRCARTSRGMLQWEAIQAMERLGTTREELEALEVKPPNEADPETR